MTNALAQILRRLRPARREPEADALADDLLAGRPPAGRLARDEQVALARALARRPAPTGEARELVAATFSTSEAYWDAYSDLKARRAPQRAAAAELLGAMAVEAAGPALVGALHDGDAAVRTAAARALGRVQAPDTVPPLRRLLGDDAPSVRAAAAAALGELRDSASLWDLIDVARKDADEPARAAAFAAAAIDPETVSAAAVAVDAGPHLREAAAARPA